MMDDHVTISTFQLFQMFPGANDESEKAPAPPKGCSKGVIYINPISMVSAPDSLSVEECYRNVLLS